MNEYVSIVSIISIIGLLWLVFFPYQSYRIDKFRQSMFGLRYQLFLYAAQGNIGFDHPLYKLQREMINSFIRFADGLNVLELLMLAMSIKETQSTNYRQEFLKRGSDLPKEKRKYFDSIQYNIHKQVGMLVILRSPFLLSVIILPIALAMVLFALAFASANRIKKNIKRVFLDIDSIAYKCS